MYTTAPPHCRALPLPPLAQAVGRLVARPMDSDARAFRMRLDAYAANQAQISPVFEGSGVVLRSHYQSLSRGAGARGVVHLTLSGFSLFPFFLSLS